MQSGENQMFAQDLENQHSALNGSDIMLRALAIRQMNEFWWGVGTDVPVSTAPFLHDCAKPDEETGSTRHPDPAVKSLNDVVSGQNERLRSETWLDMVATHDSNSAVLCTEIKRQDPQFANWVFANPVKNRQEFSAICMTTSSRKPDDLLHVPENRDVKGLSVRMTGHELRLDAHIYDQCASFKKDGNGRYRPSGSLAGASKRIVEGTFGLVVESLIRRVSSGEGKSEQHFIPIIVTTANILSCEYDQNELTEDGVSNVDLAPKNAAIYDCPVPAGARFPNQIADARRGYRTDRRSVLVVNPRGLGEFLRGLR